ncbi:hypothetical protein HPP92_019547 [Vanilla planifolia]|uniref:Endonuclease/exonuclease/phosphatase domain-containing protein n=1 Tax=Vanilla planifolia TaxID=51239 RepID=A0A835UL18_VANPL|nr:hypothetical protein HPP92_019547 [Vanilla planifolia]
MTARLMIWNIRGVRDRKSKGYLRRMVRGNSVEVVALMEIKANNFQRKDADWLLGRGWNFAVQPSEGMSAGIIIMWSWVNINITITTLHMVAFQINLEGRKVMNCCVIYGPKDHCRRREVWEEVRCMDTGGNPLMVAGDFNIIMSQEEKRGGRKFRFGKEQQELADLMQDMQLTDVGFIGNIFTWCNGKTGGARILERLDRVLLNSVGLQDFPNCAVTHLGRLGSDHCPLLIDIGCRQARKRISRAQFEIVWLQFSQGNRCCAPCMEQKCER